MPLITWRLHMTIIIPISCGLFYIWIYSITKKSSSMSDRVIYQNHGSNAIYGLGFIGAAIYYLMHATSFFAGVIGFLKAILWPAFLVYEALKQLGA